MRAEGGKCKDADKLDSCGKRERRHFPMPGTFVITHYADDVEYQAEGMIEKNIDRATSSSASRPRGRRVPAGGKGCQGAAVSFAAAAGLDGRRQGGGGRGRGRRKAREAADGCRGA